MKTTTFITNAGLSVAGSRLQMQSAGCAFADDCSSRSDCWWLGTVPVHLHQR